MCANPLWNILTIWKRKINFWQSFAERTKMLDFILFFTSNDIPQLMWSLWVFPRKSGCPCLIWGKMADTIEKKKPNVELLTFSGNLKVKSICVQIEKQNRPNACDLFDQFWNLDISWEFRMLLFWIRFDLMSWMFFVSSMKCCCSVRLMTILSLEHFRRFFSFCQI